MLEYDEVSDQVDEDVEDAITDEVDEGQSMGDWIIEKLSYFAGLPICLAAAAYLKKHNLWPEAVWKIILVGLGILLVIMFLVFLALHTFKYMVLGFFFTALVVLGFNSIKGNRYGFRQLGDDYKSLLYKAQGKQAVSPPEENDMQAQTPQSTEIKRFTEINKSPRKQIVQAKPKKHIPVRRRLHAR